MKNSSVSVTSVDRRVSLRVTVDPSTGVKRNGYGEKKINNNNTCKTLRDAIFFFGHRENPISTGTHCSGGCLLAQRVKYTATIGRLSARGRFLIDLGPMDRDPRRTEGDETTRS